MFTYVYEFPITTLWRFIMKGNVKRTLYSGLKRFERAYNVMLMALCMALVYVMPAAATAPKLVTGTVELFKTATTWLLIIIPVAAGLYLGFHALMKSLAEDNAVIAEKNKLMKNVLIGAAIAEGASGLVTVVLSFYS